MKGGSLTGGRKYAPKGNGKDEKEKKERAKGEKKREKEGKDGKGNDKKRKKHAKEEKLGAFLVYQSIAGYLNSR